MTDTGTTAREVTHVQLPSGELSLDLRKNSGWSLGDLLGFGVRRNPRSGAPEGL